MLLNLVVEALGVGLYLCAKFVDDGSAADDDIPERNLAFINGQIQLKNSHYKCVSIILLINLRGSLIELFTNYCKRQSVIF